MFIVHVALQGCLRARDVPYGVTPDTGGHIKYVLELVAAAEALAPELRQQIVVRRFRDETLGPQYDAPSERISDRSEIVRIPGATPGYIPKEDLRFELPELCDRFEAHLRGLPRLPDVIHAHYADAGHLAAEMKRRLGLPFVFTAHSLGRVKAHTLADGARDAALRDRIAMEDAVIGFADRIVASSMDEAELQYGLYPSAHPEIIRVNPPGCDLEAFGPGAAMGTTARVARDKFLSDPGKPPILALARPVRKKNLAGLVHAFGQSPALQEAANLVIYAGTRGAIEDEDAEPRAVLDDLLRLIDFYDLWGRVAIPKTHRPGDIPAIYRDAVRRRGIFANLALNEPFGLTFLEAAASGLPVVATDRGGPNDILERCRNGRLVDPTDSPGIAAAMLGLLTDCAAWDRASGNGRAACGYYSWDRHARDYLEDLARITRPAAPAGADPRERRFSRMLACDIDGTLTGDRAALGRLRDWLVLHPDTAFGIATGRSLHSALDIIREWQIPAPHFLITSVGSEIYWARDRLLRDLCRDRNWPRAVPGWAPARIEAALRGPGPLRPQPPREQRRFKRSYFLEQAELCAEVRRKLTRSGLGFELIYSHGRFLDILPPGVSKGHATRHVARQLGLGPGDIWAAGDSGNDARMLEMAGNPIIVGNHSPELDHLRGRKSSYFAQGSHAAGILEGLLHDG